MATFSGNPATITVEQRRCSRGTAWRGLVQLPFGALFGKSWCLTLEDKCADPLADQSVSYCCSLEWRQRPIPLFGRFESWIDTVNGNIVCSRMPSRSSLSRFELGCFRRNGSTTVANSQLNSLIQSATYSTCPLARGSALKMSDVHLLEVISGGLPNPQPSIHFRYLYQTGAI
jgi:hypothetical protein